MEGKGGDIKKQKISLFPLFVQNKIRVYSLGVVLFKERSFSAGRGE